MKMYKIENIEYSDKEVIITYSNNNERYDLKISTDNYVENPLVVNQEISMKVIDNIKRKEEYLKIKEYALILIGKYEYSTYKLTRSLLKKYSNLEDIKQVIDEFIQKGYLNDNEYISNYIENKITKKYGRSRIKMELLNEGIENLDETLFEKYDDIEIDNARKLTDKYVKKHQNISADKLQQKLYRYLYGLGYEEQVIEQIFKENNLIYY